METLNKTQNLEFGEWEMKQLINRPWFNDAKRWLITNNINAKKMISFLLLCGKEVSIFYPDTASIKNLGKIPRRYSYQEWTSIRCFDAAFFPVCKWCYPNEYLFLVVKPYSFDKDNRDIYGSLFTLGVLSHTTNTFSFSNSISKGYICEDDTSCFLVDEVILKPNGTIIESEERFFENRKKEEALKQKFKINDPFVAAFALNF